MESSPPLIAVPPTSPAAAYLGGKRRLAARIIPALQAMQHRTYVEPFVGMGGIFLRRPWKSPAEVINDLNTDVANLFRILQRHFQPFMDTLKWQITSRAEFERLAAAKAETLTDLERAARFIYLQRLAFGGKVTGQNFGVSVGLPSRFDTTRLAPLLEHIHDRLAGVVIERLPYAALIDRYDREDTLFYLDPPYWDCEEDYGRGSFSKADFERLAEQLGRIHGRFMLSLNDTPGVRACFAGFNLEEVQTGYTISKNRAPVGELIITARPRRVVPKRALGKPLDAS
jgi:DNA adenine methylase